MKDSEGLKGIIQVAIVFLVIWGIFGLLSGDGFFGGIAKQFDAIGEIVAMVLKGAVFLGVGWLILDKVKDRDNKTNGS